MWQKVRNSLGSEIGVWGGGTDPYGVAHQRLYRKFSPMEKRGKASCKAAVAVGRELLGFGGSERLAAVSRPRLTCR